MQTPIMQTPIHAVLRLTVVSVLLAVTLQAAPIDRHALVTRHDVVLTNFDAANPLSVGNGEFCLHRGRDRPANFSRSV